MPTASRLPHPPNDNNSFQEVPPLAPPDSQTTSPAGAPPHPKDRATALSPSNQLTRTNSRKRYTNDHKRRILQQADQCNKPGELAALLRREGIYHSTLADFRKQRERGQLDSKSTKASKTGQLTSKTGSRQQESRDQQARLEKELAHAQRQVRHLQRELQRKSALIEWQKKVSQLLQSCLETPEMGQPIAIEPFQND